MYFSDEEHFPEKQCLERSRPNHGMEAAFITCVYSSGQEYMSHPAFLFTINFQWLLEWRCIEDFDGSCTCAYHANVIIECMKDKLDYLQEMRAGNE